MFNMNIVWTEEGHFGDNAYNGKIEKLKGKKYTICYWGLDQTYEDDLFRQHRSVVYASSSIC